MPIIDEQIRNMIRDAQLVVSTDMSVNATAYPTASGGSNLHIGLSREILDSMANSIVHIEISKVDDTGWLFSLDKLTEMLNSEDKEMVTLAITVLKDNTKYAGKLLEVMKKDFYSSYDLQPIIDQYTRNNKFNLTDKIV